MAGSGHRGFIRTTLAGGVLFLVPVVAIIAILEKALGLLRRAAAPLARALELPEVAGISAPLLLAAVGLVAVCFLAGLFARTRTARRLVDWLEAKFLFYVPGYAYIKSLGERAVRVEPPDAVVLARIEDAWQIAFLVERLPDGQRAVFVPGAPDTKSGSVYFMTDDRIRTLDIPMGEAVKCLRRLGKGSGALIGRGLEQGP
jgi:uncharacterized membrane protein